MKYLHGRPSRMIPGRKSSFEFISKVKEIFSGLPFVLVVKNGTKARCSCYNDLEHSFNSKCQICAGTGWVPTIEKHRAYWQSSGTANQLPRMLDVQEPAVIMSDARMFYFYANASIDINDTVIVTSFDSELPSYNTMEFYEVNHIEPKFDETGTLIYKKVACEKSPIDAKTRTVAIYNLRHTIKSVEIPM